MALGVPNQESALNTLDRVLGVAVSRRIPDEQRRELGFAISWLQRLVDCGVLAAMDSGIAATDRAGDDTKTASPGGDSRKVA